MTLRLSEGKKYYRTEQKVERLRSIHSVMTGNLASVIKKHTKKEELGKREVSLVTLQRVNRQNQLERSEMTVK